MYKENEEKSSNNKGKFKAKDNPASPFQISTMGSTHGIENGKSAAKLVRFVDSGSLLMVKITNNIKGPTTPLISGTESTPKAISGLLVIRTRNPKSLVMAISHGHGDFVVPGSEDQSPIKFHRIRDPPPLDLLGDLHSHEQVQY